MVFLVFFRQKKISGSGDPFGIRRITISIIKILIENNLELDLYRLMQECQEIYKKQNLNFPRRYFFYSNFFLIKELKFFLLRLVTIKK